MNKIFDNKQEFTELYRDAVMSISGKSVEAASDLDRFNALAKLVAEKARTVATKSDARAAAEGKKRVYYFSIEFLIGRLLDNYLLNFGVRDMVAEALDDMGFDLSVIENQEPDPALGNGGLGRLAACFLDSMAAEGIAGYGNGMRYRYGLFKQEIVNGSQVEATDEWLTHGYPWEVRRQDKAVTIKFGGHVEGFEENGRTFYRTVDTQDILAVPYDIPVVGYAGETVNKLRVWAAEPVEEHFDLEAFNRGDYALADAERAEAEAISAILYPNDAGEHGRLLRLKQEYLFVSAGIYSLLDTFEKEHGANWELLPQFVAIHTNDTHPAMCGPELMRILIDEKKLEWDDAWNIVTQVVSYTNHTILPEALEKWPIGTFSKLLPRVYQIIDEISRRWHESFDTTQEGWQERLRQTAILWDGEIRMANLSVICSHSVNGVAKIHSDIIKNIVLKDFYALTPEKFNNKTNGITFRRWLLSCNHELAAFLTQTIGDGYKKDADELQKLLEHKDDQAVLDAIYDIKKTKKAELVSYIKEKEGVELNPDSIFDIQVKRLHEYKRQQMNALYIIHKYLEIKGGRKPSTPLTFIFGAKAAPAYVIAQDIIHLLLVMSDIINNDPEVSPYMKLVMVENYNVSYAEKLIPACDISEQISLASKEASGTGNMKFMLNGAVTLGTSDGANVEIHELVGDDNIYIFGKDSDTVIKHYEKADYVSKDYYKKSPVIKEAVDFIVSKEVLKVGKKENLERLYNELLNKDWFMTLLDLEDYIKVKDQAFADYEDQQKWKKMMLVNIAKAGFFSSDRTIAEYNRDIWKLK